MTDAQAAGFARQFFGLMTAMERLGQLGHPAARMANRLRARPAALMALFERTGDGDPAGTARSAALLDAAARAVAALDEIAGLLAGLPGPFDGAPRHAAGRPSTTRRATKP